jgi:ABC-type uncharacterized transport system substrate-binding protein
MIVPSALNRLLLGVLLIGLSSAILLFSDLRHRAVRPELQRVALFQFATSAPLDDCVDGVLDGLEVEGFADGQGMKIDRYKTVRHVFCGVTDPFGAGVGISREAPGEHPEHLTGIGTFQPVEATFRTARQLYPELKRVGEVWNPAEACSEACTVKAREICRELGIELTAGVETGCLTARISGGIIGRQRFGCGL